MDYVTPSVARFSWTVMGTLGPDSEFAGYELWIGPDRDSVRTRQAPAMSLGPREDPNLRALRVNDTDSSAYALVIGLQWPVNYYAQVVAFGPEIDTEPQVLAQTSVINFDTPPQADKFIDIYRDSLSPEAQLTPEDVHEDPNSAFAGTVALSFDGDGSQTVFGYADPTILLEDLPDDAFESAYLEFALRCSDVVPRVELNLSATEGTEISFSFPDFVICGPEYRLVQIPLSRFRGTGADGRATAQDFRGFLKELRIVAAFPQGPVSFDEIRIGF